MIEFISKVRECNLKKKIVIFRNSFSKNRKCILRKRVERNFAMQAVNVGSICFCESLQHFTPSSCKASLSHAEG